MGRHMAVGAGLPAIYADDRGQARSYTTSHLGPYWLYGSKDL